MTARFSYFVSTESQPRVRRAADAVTAIVGVLLLLWGVVGYDTVTPWEQALADVLTTLPSWASTILAMAYAVAL
ncbi:MAG: hypothetical protein EHM57_00045, partial [Actinobacteria bacterium]